jgi:hypothetical protein
MPVSRRPALVRACFAALTAAVWLAADAFPAAGVQAAAAGGQARAARRTLTAVPAAGPVRIDGVLSEACWRTAGESGFTQSEPLDGRPPTEKTTVWVAFDGESLYVAARLDDTSPDGIVARLGRRDEAVESDWFIAGFDPYLDRRSGYFFAVNPAGSIMDGTLFNDEGKDLTWDGVWDAAARVDASGWTVEMRIPFHQLRFRRESEPVWGVNFQRGIRRKNETDFLVWVPKEESGFVSRFADLEGLRGIRPGRRVELLPFAAGRAERSPAEPGNPFRTGREAAANAGFDLKAGLRSDLTLDLSVNPDFGQVEVDPAVINISDQETYYQEKRPFFIEGASIFGFGKGGPNVSTSYGWTDPGFFYSRRIGRSPQGAVSVPGFVDRPDWTTILGAAKVTGKLGRGFSLGVVAAMGGRESARVDEAGLRSEVEVEPFTSYGVVRGLKELGDGRSGLGFIATSAVRDLRDPGLASRLAERAFSLGLDGWTFLGRDKAWALSGWTGATLVEGTPAAITRLQTSSLHYFQRPDAPYVEVDETATSLSGWAGRLYLNKQKGQLLFNAALGAMSPGFEANDLGYHTRGDVINGHVSAGWRVFHPGPLLRTWSAWLTYYRSYDFGGNRVGEYWYADGEAQLLSYGTVGLHLDYEPPKYSHYLTRGGPMAFYPSGSTAQVSLASDGRKALVGKLKASYRYHPSGGFNYSLSVGLTWKPSPNFSLSAAPGWTYRFAEGQWITKVVDPLKTSTMGVRYVFSDIVQKILPVEIRLNWTFTPRLGLQAYLQPYLGTGDFSLFKELRAVRTFDFDVYGRDGSTLDFAGGVYTADPDGPDGPAAAFSFREPDFNLKSLRGTIVFRWEYRPGSMLYFVWTQKRSDAGHPGDFDFERDWAALWSARGDNIFLLKFSYRFEF